ncbi:hypothetical protein D9756_007828 [Leucocoprinus leucothites]|uniref:S-adenosyl-L-methionine-dependent methyltransferase n=1 Tax=Leucocoprinus leucothites TaxID=201217 RepID=A0A8H5D5Y6_9AGAR|nr:hypothetical protein D9756_007828 [Leucoagaricus leucothites]
MLKWEQSHQRRPNIYSIMKSQELYTLPKGGRVEHERLETQHEMWLTLVNGLYPQEVKSEVESKMRQSTNPAILDVGCGSAIWSIQMAHLFPNATIVGLDMTPLGRRDLPPNFSFSSYNFANGLPSEYRGRFDIIHCRTVAQHVPDPQGLVNSMAEALKPGGLLLLADIEMVAHDENRKPLKPVIYNPSRNIEENLTKQDERSWHSGWVTMLGSSTLSPSYQSPRIHVERSEALTILIATEFWASYGLLSEDDDERTKRLGELTGEDLRQLYSLAGDVFAKTMSQVPKEFTDALMERGLNETMTHKRHNRFWYVVGTKA